MGFRPVNAEIHGRFVRTGNLRPDSGIGRNQRMVGKARPITPYRVAKTLHAAGINGVVDGVHPFHIRPETSLAGKIESEMHAKAMGVRCGVDQP
ncbi:hypothetical protein D3C72_1288280 [compost metagenome]